MLRSFQFVLLWSILLFYYSGHEKYLICGVVVVEMSVVGKRLGSSQCVGEEINTCHKRFSTTQSLSFAFRSTSVPR